jgi:CRP-like cAMP-binding protein
VATFAGVEARDLRRLAALLDRVEIGPGHVLVAEGCRNQALWLLLTGSARTSIGGREVGRLYAPALVGGPSMVYDRPAIATVTALEAVSALVAGRAQFQAIVAIDTVALHLKAATADRLIDYLIAGERPSPSGAPNGTCALA